MELEAPDRVRTTEVETLEDRQGVLGPTEAVARLGARRDDVIEPDLLEIGLQADHLDEPRVTTEPGEVEGQRGLAALGRRRDEVATVARQRQTDRGRHGNPLLRP